MGKFILFSLNLIFLVTYKFFFGGDVEIDQNIPSQVNAGEFFTIEISIDKGEREGFAKWQQELPEGFIATAGETAGATFSFKRNTVKLIWMALPEEESFTISYQIQTDPNLNGTFDLNGKFSFIEENDRKDITTASKKINVGTGGPAIAATETVKDPEPKAEETTPAVEKIEPVIEEVIPVVAIAEVPKESSTAVAPAITSAKGGITIHKKVTQTEDIKVERTIKVMSNGQYIVNLVIDKQSFDSFGKVEEYIPTGYKASQLETDQGMFSFNNNVMKILWMTLPSKSTLEVSYKLESLNDELDSATVHGVFSFLRGEESVQLAIKGSRFPNTFNSGEMLAEEKKDAPIIEEAEVAAIVPQKPAPTKTEEIKKEITSMPAPETSVSYKVQIAAGKKEVSQDYFVKRHGIQESVSIDYHNSWYKYMIGSYEVYKEARDKRNEIWAADNKIKDAFVTAYNSGERISVQEALMITQQKWFK